MSRPAGEEGDKLGELLGRWVQQRLVHGVLMDPETLCRDDPALLQPLKECIREYEHVDRLLTAPHGLVGRHLLHYRIVAELGAGGMGRVYAAEDTKLGRRVALKVLPPEMADEQERLERFRREARIVAGLNHPNIVTLFSVEEADGVHFLTMELVQGKTLAAVIAEGGPGTALLEVAGQLADALVAAHERGVVHRDLKPANVIIGADGRLKVLDFGLAKLRPLGTGETDWTETLTARPGTAEGHILGTLPYMSPEQLQGLAVDPRTDLFSFGIILYEMATGQRPFRGENMAELISAILRDPPAPLPELRSDLSPGWERIVRRCLEKDPKDRFQSALELRGELHRLEQEVGTDQAPETRAVLPPRPPAHRLARPVFAALAMLSVFFGFWWVNRETGVASTRSQEPVQTTGAPRENSGTERPSIAVLFFDNLAGDPELDWLSGGITEMLVTDLAQDSEIEVLTTSRLYQVLKDMDALERTVSSFELAQELAEKAGVEAVVRGSYARVGDVLRIAFTIEDAASGKTLAAKRVEGQGEESLFALVDELSAAIRNDFEIERPAEEPASVRDMTTSSLEAWRFYSEAVAFTYQSKHMEAIALLEKAVEVDPAFALALAYLGNLHGNLGHTTEAREYRRRAFELADRLPPDQRYRMEGTFYSTWATYDRGVEAYRQGLRLHPDWPDLRSNLAYDYAYLERYEEAIEELDRLIADGYPGDSTLAADVYAALGRFETGYRLLADSALQHPDNWSLQLKLGWILIEWGKLAEATRHLDRAAELRPFDYNVPYGRWRLRVRLEDWEQADVEATSMVGSRDPLAQWRGAISLARNLTYRGRTGEALIRFDEAIRARPGPDAYSALARCWKAELLLQRGQADLALAEARLARQEGRDEFPELEGVFLAALAEQRLQRPAQAEAMMQILRRSWEDHPNKVEERQLDHLAGLLALDRGEAEEAVRALARAESLLPPRGIEIHWHVYPDHVPIWYALGESELAAGRDQEARRWFEKAARASEHVEQPVPYVRSFYFLGRIHLRSGETGEARRSFDRFLRFWQGGDIDRDRVDEAKAAVRRHQL